MKSELGKDKHKMLHKFHFAVRLLIVVFLLSQAYSGFRGMHWTPIYESIPVHDSKQIIEFSSASVGEVYNTRVHHAVINLSTKLGLMSGMLKEERKNNNKKTVETGLIAFLLVMSYLISWYLLSRKHRSETTSEHWKSHTALPFKGSDIKFKPVRRGELQSTPKHK